MFQTKEIRSSWVRKFRELKPEELHKRFPVPTFRFSIPLNLRNTETPSRGPSNMNSLCGKMKIVSVFEFQEEIFLLQSDAISAEIRMVDIMNQSTYPDVLLKMTFGVTCVTAITPKFNSCNNSVEKEDPPVEAVINGGSLKSNRTSTKVFNYQNNE